MSAPTSTKPDGLQNSMIEAFGLRIGDAMGWPRMAGRAAGALMLSEKPLTLAELQDALEASKGSVSETTRLLIDNGVVDRFKESGQRHFVYQWRSDAWIGCLKHQLHATEQLFEFAQHAEGMATDLADEQRRRLYEMAGYYRFMVERLQKLLAEYIETWNVDQEEP